MIDPPFPGNAVGDELSMALAGIIYDVNLSPPSARSVFIQTP